MKPFASPFPSPTPSSSPSSCNYVRTTRGSCMYRILRRILCFSSLPLSCPFDHSKGDEDRNTTPRGVSPSTPVPSIVARLMGLESLPIMIEHNPTDSIKKGTRSSTHARRGRVIPLSYQELEDENFFILSFEHCSDRRRRKKKSVRRRKESLEEMERENNGLVSVRSESESDFTRENDQENVLRDVKNSCQKPVKMREKLKTEGDSENSSPNSVLDFVEFPADDQETACSGDISRLANCKLRRTLSEELENCGKRSNENKKLVNNKQDHKLIRLRNTHHNYYKKLEDISKLAAMDMVKSSWIDKEMLKNRHFFEEMGRDLASEVLDRLLDELIID